MQRHCLSIRISERWTLGLVWLGIYNEDGDSVGFGSTVIAERHHVRFFKRMLLEVT